jgi:uncharacterized membrane protein YeaQ/YmgE (transglycosylase-associated protein family)
MSRASWVWLLVVSVLAGASAGFVDTRFFWLAVLYWGVVGCAVGKWRGRIDRNARRNGTA